jgi:hypothetical protein
VMLLKSLHVVFWGETDRPWLLDIVTQILLAARLAL